jgi:hypothetical protein
MAYWSRVEAYQRLRTNILRDIWLIDNDHKEDENEGASEAGSDEGTPDASTAAGQSGRAQRPSNPGHGDNSGDGAGAPGGMQGALAEADDIGHHRTATRKEAEVAEAEEEFPPVGETAPEMMHTMNMVLRNIRDHQLMDIETGDEGQCHKECFLRRCGPMWNMTVTWRQGKPPSTGSSKERISSSPTPHPQLRPSPRESRRPPGSRPKS